MINLRIRSEFHFDFSSRGFGRINQVVACVKALGQSHAALTDSTTFGHIEWYRQCKAAGVEPLLGAEIRVPLGEDEGIARVTLIARNNDGLEEMYKLTSLAASDAMTLEALLGSSADVIKLTGTLHGAIVAKAKWKGAYADISPSTPPDLRAEKLKGKLPIVAVGDNSYPTLADRPAFSLFGGAIEQYSQHILSARECRALLADLPDAAFAISDTIAKSCKVDLPQAVNMTIKGDLEKICRAGIKSRLGRWTKRYEERLTRELGMIREKNFESYFLIISDMVRYAKKNMLVGPARGSAAGSLVCFLAYITDIDPIVHGLLFERFIDVTRADLPDIDLDFPDNRRQMVIDYLQKQYGADNVVHLGTVLTFQPRSILKLVSRKLDIKMYEFTPLLDTMIERSSGDSRAAMCLLDTLEGMDAGRLIMDRFPQVRIATAFEGHANTAGTHAAGIIVCAEPVRKFCTVDARTSTAQLDKIDAEKINLLKIDILGLRTLSVLEHAISLLPERIDLTKAPLDDAGAFSILNNGKWAGIFQFEGDAVQMLTKQITIDRFSDIVALSALARPGPLNSGGATTWANRRAGREQVIYLHPAVKEFTEATYGIVAYQEQVMRIGRELGQLDWEDISEIRKAMSKSKGEEFFGQYWERFKAGAMLKGLSERDARHVWDNMQTMGSWAFNESHAVAYGLISYWCAYLKHHYPLEFAAATLRHTKNDEQTIAVLRELKIEGIDYTAFDARVSAENWTVIDGRLVGGFVNLKGIGETTAAELVAARVEGWTDKQIEKIVKAEVLYSDIFPTHRRYGRIYESPKECGFPGIEKVWTAKEIDDAKARDTLPSEFYFINRLIDKVPRDLNEYVFQVKRVQEGRPKLLSKDTAYLNIVGEDDTARIYATINNRTYEDVGKPIVNNGVVGKSWYMFRGRLNQLRRINVNWASDITDKEFPSSTERTNDASANESKNQVDA